MIGVKSNLANYVFLLLALAGCSTFGGMAEKEGGKGDDQMLSGEGRQGSALAAQPAPGVLSLTSGQRNAMIQQAVKDEPAWQGAALGEGLQPG